MARCTMSEATVVAFGTPDSSTAQVIEVAATKARNSFFFTLLTNPEQYSRLSGEEGTIQLYNDFGRARDVATRETRRLDRSRARTLPVRC